MTPWLFETSRLAVRPKTVAEAEEFQEVYGDAEVMRHLGGAFTSLAETREFVAAHVRHQEAHGFSMWTLLERSTGTLIGDVGFLTYDGGVEIGWHLRGEAWGRGYATEAARATLAYGFGELAFTQVSAFVEKANTASVRVIEKLGMRLVREGADDVPPWAEYVIRP